MTNHCTSLVPFHISQSRIGFQINVQNNTRCNCLVYKILVLSREQEMCLGPRHHGLNHHVFVFQNDLLHSYFFFLSLDILFAYIGNQPNLYRLDVSLFVTAHMYSDTNRPACRCEKKRACNADMQYAG
jgi:hypothetical protein